MPWLSSRWRILLRFRTNQFLILGGLEEAEPEPDPEVVVVEVEVEEEEENLERRKSSVKSYSNLRFCWLAGNVKSKLSPATRSEKRGTNTCRPHILFP